MWVNDRNYVTRVSGHTINVWKPYPFHRWGTLTIVIGIEWRVRGRTIVYPSVHRNEIGDETRNFAFDYRSVASYHVFVFSFGEITLYHHCKTNIVDEPLHVLCHRVHVHCTAEKQTPRSDIKCWIHQGYRGQYPRHAVYRHSFRMQKYRENIRFTNFIRAPSIRVTLAGHPGFHHDKISHKRRYVTL